MNTASQLLLIIVSSALTLLVLVLVAVGVKLLMVLHKLQHLIDQAEKLTDSAEAAAQLFRKSAGPVVLCRVLGQLAKKVVINHNKSTKGD